MITRCVLLLLFFSFGLNGQEPSKVHTSTPIGYELYSWQESDGSWLYSLLYTTNSEKTAQQVFRADNVLHGTEQLKRKIATLPPATHIHWVDRVPLGTNHPKAVGSEKLAYPPRTMILEIREYAETHKVRILIHGSPHDLP